MPSELSSVCPEREQFGIVCAPNPDVSGIGVSSGRKVCYSYVSD